MASKAAAKRSIAPAPAAPADPAADTPPVIEAAGHKRKLLARADAIDFRDLMYRATLVEVPMRRELALYRTAQVPILDQGQEGACTGFGLATVAHYLLRTRRGSADGTPVSPYMFYDMARRYDEWAGVNYEGSSCRGAIKGWYKHGVCSVELWRRQSKKIGVLTAAIVADAGVRPLGAYLRVNHKSLVDMHAAISEAGVLYASAKVHRGWQEVGADGVIAHDATLVGGHAFAIVAYDEHGFWVQNSWGADWGMDGYGRLSYADWLQNGSDVWVVRLGVPVLMPSGAPRSALTTVGAVRAKPYLYHEIRPHVIGIRGGGQLDEHGDIATSAEMTRHILRDDFTRITAGWKRKRLVLYAHGGLSAPETALQHLSSYRKAMLDAECYPLAFIWHADYWDSLGELLGEAIRHRRPEGSLDGGKDFMLDRLDDLLEPIGRTFGGKAEWDGIKDDALRATSLRGGGARVVADQIAELHAACGDTLEIHLVGHSAGAVLLAALLQYLTESGVATTGPMAASRAKGLGLRVASCTLWAPACTVELFKQTYLPSLRAGSTGKLTVFTLTERAEQDDNVAGMYNKSLLYLISNAFERRYRNPLLQQDGEPLLGLEKSIAQDAELAALFASGAADWVRSPNTEPVGGAGAAQAAHHGSFDEDDATLKATIARITGGARSTRTTLFRGSHGACQSLRRRIDLVTRKR
ncbi:MAG: C1 family peptidase [Pseudomonadota bacterium]